ncbi:MAG TPA: hypothetical protein VGL42_13675 [Opitutaceae bacterium]|jgi:hypothetical protein
MKKIFAFTLALAATEAGLAQTVNVSVDAGNIVRPVDDRQFSINAAAWDSYLTPGNQATTAALVAPLAIRALRYPGGSPSDGYHWATNTNETGSYIAPGLDYNAFLSFANSLPAQVMITTNYGSGTPQEAAAWVEDANVTHHYGIKYWEVGNEIYGTWEYDHTATPHDPVEYANRFAQYYQAMKANDPTIRIGAVVITGLPIPEESYASSHTVVNPVTQASHTGWTPVMLSTLKSLGVTPDFVVYHRYEEETGKEDDASLLQDAQGWIGDATSLRMMLTDYLGGAGAGVEILATENNSNGETAGKQMVSIVNGLYMADSFCTLMQTEINSLFWWDLRNEQETDGNLSAQLYGWRQYGDSGIMSGATTFYPTYYVYKLMSHFARGGDAVVKAASSSNLLSAYAAKRGDGSLSVLVINKSPTATTSATIALSNFTPAATATVYSYGLPQDNAAETETNNSQPEGADADVQVANNVAIAGASFTGSFGPYSVTLYSIPSAQASASSARLINISSNGYVQGTTHLLDAGFFISGAPGSTEQVLVRGIGPTLATFNVPNPASNIQLQIFDANNHLLYSNNGWSSGSAQNTQNLTAAFNQTFAFGLQPGTLDSALLVTLAPGQYTAEVSGVGDASGTALAEVYEVTAGGTRLLNISCRGYVDNAGHTLTDGFYISGGSNNGQEKVLIRGVGPTLANFGVNPAVADPTLTVFEPGNVPIATSDDWSAEPDSGLAAAFTATLAFQLPAPSRDAAVLLTLPGNGYTAQVSGTNGQGGDAIVEIYEVPQS